MRGRLRDTEHAGWRRRTRWKRYFILISLLTLVMCAAGWASGQQDQGGAAIKGANLQMWMFKTFVPSADQLMMDAANKWAAANNAQVSVTQITWGDMPQKIVTAIESNSLPDLAETMLEPYLYYKMGKLLDVSDVIANVQKVNGPMYPSVLSNITANGKQFAIPEAEQTEVIYARKDLFQAAGLDYPKTWDDFKAAATKLTMPDKKNLRRCLSLCPEL